MCVTRVETSTRAEARKDEAAAGASTGYPTVLEPGQVVEVRESTWAVANVQAQGLPPSPADECTR